MIKRKIYIRTCTWHVPKLTCYMIASPSTNQLKAPALRYGHASREINNKTGHASRISGHWWFQNGGGLVCTIAARG